MKNQSIKILISICFLCNSLSLFACKREAERVLIYPSAENLTQNPIFLIDYAEIDFKIFQQLKNATFYLKNEKGEQFPLRIEDTVNVHRNNTQILLKSIHKLSLNSKVFISVNGFQSENDSIKTFIQLLEAKKWIVSYDEDKIKPKFKRDISLKYERDKSSADGHGVEFRVYYDENNKFIGEFNRREILLKITTLDGINLYLVILGNHTGIYDGLCGGNLEIRYNQEYLFIARLVDMSGNESEILVSSN
jgi:hypothetical protein